MYCVGIFKNPLPSISTLLSLVRGSAPTQFNTVRFPLNFETVVLELMDFIWIRLEAKCNGQYFNSFEWHAKYLVLIANGFGCTCIYKYIPMYGTY